MLSDSESSGDEQVHQLTINEHYAKAYQNRKEREELQKLQDKYGSEGDISDESTDSESAESEDEDGEELTPAVDAAILRTLARIKRKDPSIYESGKDIYIEEQQRVKGIAQKKKDKDKDKSKPVTLRQVALEATLEGGSRSPSPETTKPTHIEEQRTLRNETIAAFHGAISGEDSDENDEDNELLIPREKTKDELEQEQEEYKAFLAKEVGSDLKDLITVEKVDADEGTHLEKISDVEVDRKKGKKKSKESEVKTKEQEDHEFLMNYILNRGWIDKSSRRIPTYNEITSSKKTKSKSKSEAARIDSDASTTDDTKAGGNDSDEAELDSDASFESLNDHFEASYNFRFEEHGAETIQTFPRNLSDIVRRQDSTRKDARARRKERKLGEVEQKREEVRRLKSLKMKEIRKKLEIIGKEGGRKKDVGEDKELQQLDLNAEWDPDQHDKQMADLYGNDTDAVVDDDKPTWEDDIDIGDIYVSGGKQPATASDSINNKKDKKKKKKKKKKDENEINEGGVDIDEMDADVVRDEDEEEEEWDGTEEMRKRKLKEYMNELDALDFNDMVGGMPTRFRYVPTKSESFALTPVEILLATDQELNQFISIRRYAPYRKGVKWDRDRNEKLRELKRKIAERAGRRGEATGQWSLHGGEGVGEKMRGEKRVKKRKGRKERMRAMVAAENGTEGGQGRVEAKRKREEENDDDSRKDEEDKKKRKRRHKKTGEMESV